MVSPDRFLLLLSYMTYCACDSYITRSAKGDSFTWDEDCALLDGRNITYFKNRPGCRCILDLPDQTSYGGTFLKSFDGNYRCFYGAGKVARNFRAGRSSCFLGSTEIPILGQSQSKKIMGRDGLHKSDKLFIDKVKYFTYEEIFPFSPLANPFTLQIHSNGGLNSKSYKLKWHSRIRNSQINFTSLAGHLLQISFDSRTVINNVTNFKQYNMLVKVPGQRKYDFSFPYISSTTAPFTSTSTTTTRATTRTTSTPRTTPANSTLTTTERTTVTNAVTGCQTTDTRCKYHYDQYMVKSKQYDDLFNMYLEERDKVTLATKVNIILGVICGVLLLVVIVLIVCLCRKDCGFGEKRPESIVIASPSPWFIPPRRSDKEKTPVPPARAPPGVQPKRYTESKNPRAPGQPLYESIHRRVSETYETPIDTRDTPYTFENLAETYGETPDYIEVEPDPNV